MNVSTCLTAVIPNERGVRTGSTRRWPPSPPNGRDDHVPVGLAVGMRLQGAKGILLDLDETLFDNSLVPHAAAPTCEIVAAKFASIDAEDLAVAYAAASDRWWPQAGPKCLTGELDALDVSREVWRQ